MKRTIMIVLAVVCLGAGLARRVSAVRGNAADERASAAAGAAEVKIDNFSFAPAAMEISAGTTVTWINRDDIPHTVVSLDKTTFKSKALDTDDKFSYKFEKPGTYEYFCSIHPKMTGDIIVH
jgi:plastocyanin